MHVHCRTQPICIPNQKFKLPTQPSCIVLEITNVQAMIIINQNDDDTDWEIRNDECVNSQESTASSHIKNDDLDIQQEVSHLVQARRDKTIQSTNVPLAKKQSHANTVIARIPLPNLRHPVGAIISPVLKRGSSAIYIACEANVVQVHLLPKGSEDYKVPQPKASGDDKVSEHQLVNV